jgi:excisionase family DNA binding protein
MENEALLTARDAAEELGIHVATVHRAFQDNRLPFIALYGRKLIRRSDLDAYKQRTRPNGLKPKGRPIKATNMGDIKQ